MVALGYSDSKFPAWWYSPAREGIEGQEVEQPRIEVQEVEQPRTEVQEGEETAGKRTHTEAGEAYAPTPPDKPRPREDRLRRPPVPVPASASDALPAPASASSAFSDLEMTILREQGISEITPGQWMRTEQLADGRIMLSPVDPRQELLSIRRSTEGEQIMGAMGENMVNQLTVHTQAIMKKVAFNPNVFQCWQFVSNALDEDTGNPFIPLDWDLGDYVSHCVAWCTEHEYGIVPTVLYNRPSRYTQLRELRRALACP